MKKKAIFPPGATIRTLTDIYFTTRGPLALKGPLAAEEIALLKMDKGLSRFRSSEQQHKALMEISRLPEGRIFVACHGETIVGYITFHKPEFSRWINTGIDEIIEMGGLEVSSSWRNLGIARTLLNYIYRFKDFEDYIVISLETYCNWDLKDSGLSVWPYQRLLKKILGEVGLETRITDDPEITDHPANMLSVRIGCRIKSDIQQQFEKLLVRKRVVN